MSVYVGIDVHRKRSQVAVINEGGEVLANRNVPNGTQPVLGVIGGLPPGTPVAFEAAFGWGWLVALLEDYGFARTWFSAAWGEARPLQAVSMVLGCLGRARLGCPAQVAGWGQAGLRCWGRRA